MTKLKRSLGDFLTDDRGQELTEYTRGVAVVVFAAAAFFLASGAGSSEIWTTTSSQLATTACLGG